MSKSAGGDRLLLDAIREGNLEQCQQLIRDGADVRTVWHVGEMGQTAIYDAVHYGREGIVKMLLDAGADLHYRAGGGDGRSLLHAAAVSGHASICSELVGRGLRIDVVESSCLAALHFAAANGHEEVCRVLLALGARTDSLDSDNWSALRYAAEKGSVGICQLLTQAGASPSQKGPSSDKLYLTPMQAAVVRDQFEVVRYFIEDCGEDRNQRTRLGRSLDELSENSPRVRSYLLSRDTQLALEATLSTHQDLMPRRSSGMSPI
jgi:ankyrin repeat protein